MEITEQMKELLAAALAATPAAIAVILGALILRFLLNRALNLIIARSSLKSSEITPVRKVINWLLMGITLILLLGIFGFNLGGLWTMLSTILAMIAIGFVAVWSVLSNVSCTAMILIFRPFAVGDELQFAGEEVKGRVVDLNFLFTTLASNEGETIQVPNNLFFQKVLLRRKSGHGISLSEQLQSKEQAGK